jgi:hypothetical protein
MPLEVALLRRAERLIKQHLGGAGLGREGLDLICLAAPDKQGRVWRPTLAANPGNRDEPGGLREQAKLLEGGIEMGYAQIDPDQNG